MRHPLLVVVSCLWCLLKLIVPALVPWLLVVVVVVPALVPCRWCLLQLIVPALVPWLLAVVVVVVPALVP